MGGVTAMQFAITYPDRLRKLVLVAPAPSGGIVNTDPSFRAITKSIRANRELRRQMARELAVRPTDDEIIDRRIEDDLKWPEVAYDEAWEAMASVRLSEAITGIRTPTLMVVGDRDGLRAANLEDAQRIPNCALQVFYRVGHEVASDVPDQFVALLDDFVEHGVAPVVTWEQRRALVEKLGAVAHG